MILERYGREKRDLGGIPVVCGVIRRRRAGVLAAKFERDAANRAEIFVTRGTATGNIVLDASSVNPSSKFE